MGASILSILAKAGIPALAALLFTACSWECQGIPEELPWFIAEDYEGKTVFFTNGQDTVEVSYDYSEMDVEENRNHSMSRGRCHTSIVQAGCWGDSWALDALRDSLKDMNYVSPLSYGMWQECYKESLCQSYLFTYRLPDTTMGVLPMGMRFTAEFSGLSMDFLQEGGVYESRDGIFCYLTEWRSIGGHSYSRVLKHVLPKTRYGLFDTIYLADRKGIVQLVSEAQGETWYLIPPEEDESSANDGV